MLIIPKLFGLIYRAGHAIKRKVFDAKPEAFSPSSEELAQLKKTLDDVHSFDGIEGLVGERFRPNLTHYNNISAIEALWLSYQDIGDVSLKNKCERELAGRLVALLKICESIKSVGQAEREEDRFTAGLDQVLKHDAKAYVNLCQLLISLVQFRNVVEPSPHYWQVLRENPYIDPSSSSFKIINQTELTKFAEQAYNSLCAQHIFESARSIIIFLKRKLTAMIDNESLLDEQRSLLTAFDHILQSPFPEVPPCISDLAQPNKKISYNVLRQLANHLTQGRAAVSAGQQATTLNDEFLGDMLGLNTSDAARVLQSAASLNENEQAQANAIFICLIEFLTRAANNLKERVGAKRTGDEVWIEQMLTSPAVSVMPDLDRLHLPDSYFLSVGTPQDEKREGNIFICLSHLDLLATHLDLLPNKGTRDAINRLTFFQNILAKLSSLLLKKRMVDGVLAADFVGVAKKFIQMQRTLTAAGCADETPKVKSLLNELKLQFAALLAMVRTSYIGDSSLSDEDLEFFREQTHFINKFMRSVHVNRGLNFLRVIFGDVLTVAFTLLLIYLFPRNAMFTPTKTLFDYTNRGVNPLVWGNFTMRADENDAVLLTTHLLTTSVLFGAATLGFITLTTSYLIYRYLWEPNQPENKIWQADQQAYTQGKVEDAASAANSNISHFDVLSHFEVLAESLREEIEMAQREYSGRIIRAVPTKSAAELLGLYERSRNSDYTAPAETNAAAASAPTPRIATKLPFYNRKVVAAGSSRVDDPEAPLLGTQTEGVDYGTAARVRSYSL